jgi:hypothetical protein
MCMTYILQQWPAIVQAISAFVIAYLTYRLAVATDNYARLTGELVAVTSRQLEREFLPNWHISFAPIENGAVRLKILNLSRASARITHLLIKVQSEDELEPRRFSLDMGMPSEHGEVTRDISQDMVEAMNPYFVNGEWRGVLEIGILFLVANSPEPRPSEAFQFRAAAHNRQLTEAMPKMPYIAGDLGGGPR